MLQKVLIMAQCVVYLSTQFKELKFKQMFNQLQHMEIQTTFCLAISGVKKIIDKLNE
jgi:hypothetical protein